MDDPGKDAYAKPGPGMPLPVLGVGAADGASAAPPQDSATTPAAALGAERKLVTVMFADISGFTRMSESMDPETVRDTINACFNHLVPSIERYGGVVDKFIGDEIMALFGAPQAHDNDAERTLHAALDMMAALDRFNAERGTSLGLHFGINTGLVLAGGVGTEKRQEYSVMGDAVNLAARLEGASKRGQIFVGQDTYRLTAGLFDFKTLAPLRLQGKAKPVPIYQLMNARTTPDQVRGLGGYGIRSPMVGRDTERGVLDGCITRLLAGEGSIVFVVGEGGLGKSRLVAETRAGAQGDGLTWLEGKALSFSRTISYWPFQEIIRQYAGITADDAEAAAWSKLAGQVMALFPEQAAEVLPYLARLLALEVQEEYRDRVRYLDGEAMGRQIFLTTLRFFERVAQARPLVLVFEDLHWADDSSVTLLEHLLSLVTRVPLVICCLNRPHHQGPAETFRVAAQQRLPDRYVEITLTPLSPADSAQLVRNLLNTADLPARVQQTILRKTEGNPFFVEEVIRAFIDLRAIVADARTGRWRATASVEQITIPDTVQGVVMARIDRLDEELKQVLRVASVVGRSFRYRVLGAISVADAELDEHLAQLVHVELIRERRHLPEVEYTFKHALVHEATYESILLKRRRQLHAQVGLCIEALFADRLEEFYGMLAYHYAQAENWDAAQQYLLKVGDQAGKIAADAEALLHYKRALEAYVRASGNQGDPFQRAVLERKMAEAFFRAGDHHQASEHLRRSLAYRQGSYPATRWGVMLATMGQLVLQAGHRLLPALFARGRTEQVRESTEEYCRIYELMARIDFFMDQERYLLDTLLWLNTAERWGYSLGTTNGLTGIGIISDVLGLVRIAGHYHRHAVVLAEQSQHPAAVATAYFGLSLHELYLGQIGEATIAHAQKASDTHWAAGYIRAWGTDIPLVHYCHLHLGNFVASEPPCRQLVQIGRDGSDPQLLAWGLLGLGRIRRHTGPLSEAISCSQEAAEMFLGLPDYGGYADAGGTLGLSYLHQGNLQQALVVLEQTARVVVAHGVIGHQVTLLRTALADAYLTAAEQAEGSERDERLNRARRACHTAMRSGRLCRIRLPYAMRLQGRHEWLRGRTAAARRWWQQSLLQAQAMGMRYEEGMTHLEIGLRLPDRVALERAEAIFAAIGAGVSLASVREALGTGHTDCAAPATGGTAAYPVQI